jgi:energy-coupling factor transporter ATP-binding protein EcfA2
MSYFYETDSDEEKKPRKLNKKNCGKPPKRIVAIKNKDKIGAEFWTPSRAKDIGNFPSPSRILLLGPCGVGKSTLIKNLILHQRPKFEEVYLVHEDSEFTKEYDDLDVSEKLNDVPSIDFWELPEGSPYIKRCVIVDDLELTSANKQRMKNLAILFRYCSTHKGLTIYFAHQSFFDVSSLVKKMANIYVLWRPRAYSELALIENRVGYPKGTLKELFNTVATGHRDSICVDMTENSPCKLRLNIWKQIQSDSESEDDD